MNLPDFRYEKRLWKRGYKLVAGADEVGRGSFAGPVFAVAVVFDQRATVLSPEIIINDSKKLRPRQREKAAAWIKENAFSWGVGAASVVEINRVGIGKATQVAFRRAVAGCRVKIDYLLVDAFCIPYLRSLGQK